MEEAPLEVIIRIGEFCDAEGRDRLARAIGAPVFRAFNQDHVKTLFMIATLGAQDAAHAIWRMARKLKDHVEAPSALPGLIAERHEQARLALAGIRNRTICGHLFDNMKRDIIDAISFHFLDFPPDEDVDICHIRRLLPRTYVPTSEVIAMDVDLARVERNSLTKNACLKGNCNLRLVRIDEGRGWHWNILSGGEKIRWVLQHLLPPHPEFKRESIPLFAIDSMIDVETMEVFINHFTGTGWFKTRAGSEFILDALSQRGDDDDDWLGFTGALPSTFGMLFQCHPLARILDSKQKAKDYLEKVLLEGRSKADFDEAWHYLRIVNFDASIDVMLDAFATDKVDWLRIENGILIKCLDALSINQTTQALDGLRATVQGAVNILANEQDPALRLRMAQNMRAMLSFVLNCRRFSPPYRLSI